MARSLSSALLQFAAPSLFSLPARILLTSTPPLLAASTVTRRFYSDDVFTTPQPESAASPPATPPNRNPLLRNLTSAPPTRTRSSSAFTGSIQDLMQKSRVYNLSVHRSLYPMKPPRRKGKRIHLPTHYVEVSYKLRKAVVFYMPSIAHIPHGIKANDPLLVTSGAVRGQNT